MIYGIDRIFCLLLGHNWELSVNDRWVWKCHLCGARVCDVELITPMRFPLDEAGLEYYRGVVAQVRAEGPPRRKWKVRH